jgi:CUB domain
VQFSLFLENKGCNVIAICRMFADHKLVIRLLYLQSVRLDFTYFYTETCCDYVFVHDGDTTKDPRIASLSGAYSTPPGGFNSTRRYMLVRFISDTDFTAGGFNATYTTVGESVKLNINSAILQHVTATSSRLVQADIPSKHNLREKNNNVTVLQMAVE